MSWKDRVWKAKDEGTNDDLNNVETGIAEAKAEAAAAAPLSSPSFVGNPTAFTQLEKNNSTRLATTAYVDNAISVETIAAEAAFDKKGEAKTEKERAETVEALKANLASPVFTGTPKAPTQAKADNSTALATTAYVDRAASEGTVGPPGPPGSGFEAKASNLGKVKGNLTLSVAVFNVFEGELEGALKIEKPTGWPAGYTEALLLLKQPAEAKKITVAAGITIVGGSFDEEPNALNVFSLVSPDGGTTVYLVNAAAGVTGPEGPKGTTGTAGEKGTTGSTGEAGPPGAIGKTKALGVLAAGKHKINVSEYQSFTGEVTGNIEIELEGWPVGDCEPIFFLTNDVSGGHTISFPEVKWEPEAPTFIESANAVNIVALASPDKGANIYGIRGQKGEKGTTGATGAKGTTGSEGPKGSGGTGALTKMILPFISGNPKVNANVAPAVAFKAFFTMAVCEVAGTLAGLYYFNGATVKGELRVAVYDTGQKTAGKYSLLTQSAAISQTNAEKCKLAALEAPFAVESGQVYMFALMTNETTATFGFQSEALNQNYITIPIAGINGVNSSLVSAPMIGTHTFAGLSFANVEKENIEINAKGICLLGHVE